MDIFKDWIAAVAGSIIFASLCEMILPSGNTKKYVSLILGIILSVNMLKPFSDIRFNSWSDGMFEIEKLSAYNMQAEFDKDDRKMVMNLYNKKLEDAALNLLTKNIPAEFNVRIKTESDMDKFGEINEIQVDVIQEEGFKDYREEIENLLNT